MPIVTATTMLNHILKLAMAFSLTSGPATAQTFSEFVAAIQTAPDGPAKTRLIDEFLSRNTIPFIEGDTVHFLYRGKGKVVAVPGEMNRWNPSEAGMKRIPDTDLFFRTYTMSSSGRVEYKIWVDSAWTLDPLNPRKARGGYGENSDLWMPGYRPAKNVEFNPTIPRGKIDTLWFTSKRLKRKHPIFVYIPPGAEGKKRLPITYIMDGGDYLSLGKMNNVLDNLLAEHLIRPLVGVFVEPRTDINNPATNKRMTDYAASKKFLDFLENELAPFVEKKYHATQRASERLIMGASMGGLISTFVVLKRPYFIENSAAQSPAYLQADSAVIKLLRKMHKIDANMYIDTGTINDTEIEAQLVKQMLEEKGARLRYAEYPEGHNWTNWRARLGTILQYFFPPR